LANDAVVDARAASAQEALDAGLIDFIARDVDDLLRQVDGVEVDVAGNPRELNTLGAQLTYISPSILEQILMVLADPNIVALLLAIGPLLIIVEIRTPGGWVAGTLGAICTGLALYGLGVLPVNWLGIIFVVLAIVLFVLEVTTPTSGVLATAAVVSMIVGAIILFSTPEIEPFGQLSIPFVIAQSVLLGVLFIFFGIMIMRGQRLPVTTGYEGMVGLEGRVIQPLEPLGTVLVWGERWKAEAEDGHHIPAGQQVRVLKAAGRLLLVAPLEKPE
jgi:membrane-bound serine protease (ClpP class)